MREASRIATPVTPVARTFGALVSCGVLALLAGCSVQPGRVGALGPTRVYDARLGVWSSPRVVADGDVVPRGGGSYLTGRPYTIAGRTYVPTANASGYSATGMASWYGDAFHGRRTANGEVFDKGSVSAAHPTLPLPSYVRVTNTKNGRSMVVRVNDRGPYHGGRVMDVSQRVAEALQFKGEGTARVRIDYVGRAALAGSDDATLMASLRTDGTPAQLEGMPAAAPVMLADADPGGPDPRQGSPDPVNASASDNASSDVSPGQAPSRLAFVPLPPSRPFDLGAEGAIAPTNRRRGRGSDHLAEVIAAPRPLSFADEEAPLQDAQRSPFRGLRGARAPLRPQSTAVP